MRDRVHHKCQGFALVSVVWLATIGFFSAIVLLGLLSGRNNALQQSQYSLEESLALDQLVDRIRRVRSFLPNAWDSPKDTIVVVGDPGYRFQVSTRRWGLWAISELTNAHTGILVGRYVLAGRRTPTAGTVGFIRSNRSPLILAHEARLLGTVVVTDSISIRPWKGIYYRGPTPQYRTGVEDFPTIDILQEFNTQVQSWFRDIAALPENIQVLTGYSVIQEPPPDNIDTIIVLGDAEVSGNWRNRPICLYAQGNIRFTPGTLFSGQVIAQGTVDICESHFSWPSLTVAQLQPRRRESTISLREGTQYQGVLIAASGLQNYLLHDEGMTAHVHIDPTSSITGAIYTHGSLWMQGELNGWMESGETYDRAEPTTYHNWILGGTWRPMPRGKQLPLYPLILSHGSFQSTVLGGVR